MISKMLGHTYSSYAYFSEISNTLDTNFGAQFDGHAFSSYAHFSEMSLVFLGNDFLFPFKRARDKYTLHKFWREI